MIYTVDMTQPSTINFTPMSKAEEVAQNIRTILTTPLGSSPLARDIGIDYSIIDEPGPIAEARTAAEVTTAIVMQEPRAQVVQVSFNGTLSDALTGYLKPVIKFSLAEGVV
ncbi:GPW/gp25 family protein [Paenibacillus sp. Marseille-Q9583]